jgi:hypothetical protein
MATFRLFPLIAATAPATNENSHDDVLPLQSRIEFPFFGEGAGPEADASGAFC